MMEKLKIETEDLLRIMDKAKEVIQEIKKAGFEINEIIELIRILTPPRELHGWEQMADYLRISVPTMIKLAKEQIAPVTLISGTPYSTTKKLDDWKEKRLKNYPYWKK